VKITVDGNACMGHGRCMAMAPEVYVLDDLGYNRMDTFEVARGLEEQARRGAMSCPESAIAVTEDGTSPPDPGVRAPMSEQSG
jgi:ferredoxin